TDPVLASDLISALESDEPPELDGDRYLLLGERLADEGERTDAYALIRRLIDLGYSPYDRLIFVLAQLYEGPGPHRDLRQARALYEELVRDYPLSVHWRESRSRIEYLDRHFFLIR
ncbi:MAG: hypothetical protein MI748_12885, partial [Opitutales bacterium]|nr:hypothetical protein [Opitutales bacterium]